MENKNKELTNWLDKIASLEEEIIQNIYDLTSNENSKMYSVDIISFTVSQRVISLIKGYLTLVKENNYTAALPLIRLQLDNGLRFSATRLVDNLDDFVSYFLEGKRINRYKDINGKRLNDAYLQKKLEPFFPGIKEVYSLTSGFVHLSHQHFDSISKVKKNGKKININLVLGEVDEYSIDNRIDFAKRMYEVTQVTLIILKEWTQYKSTLFNGRFY